MTADSPRPNLPKSIQAFFKKNSRQYRGLILLGIVGLSLFAFFTYHPQDPSFNTSADYMAKNWLGPVGAIFADLMVQLFGFSGVLLIGILGCWGWHLWQDTLRIFPTRLFMAGCAIMGIGVFFNGCLSLPLSYTHKILYPGGTLSYLVLNLFHSLFSGWHLKPLFQPFLWFLGAISTLLMWFAAGFSWRQLKIPLKFIAKIFYTCFRFVYSWFFKKPFANLATPPQNDPSLTKDRVPKQPLFKDVFQKPSKPISDDFSTLTDEPQQTGLSEHSSISKADRVLETILANQTSVDEYQLPTLELLDQPAPSKVTKTITQEALQAASQQLVAVLEEFGIRGEIVNIRPGPVVTMYELKPAAGIKTARVIGLADDIARSMSALSARIAVIPGQNVIGIELPNPQRQTVYLRQLLSSPEYQQFNAGLPLILGKDIGGQPSIADLTRMPHLLVAGTTGSGKSVSVNTMILSLLYKLPPDRCKFIMIDPKMLELSVYDDIPHLLAPVVTDAKKAVVALKWAVKEMENRYRSMAKLGVRNIDGFNVRLAEARQNGEVLVRRVQTGFDPDSGKPIFENQALDFQHLPYIVIVVDEMADLMLVAGKEIEMAVQRLAQMARAAGIHLIMATQRPSVDVITGTIKANFPTRISFQVTSKIDSRTILGEQGAEQLLGQGDMLYMAGGGRIIRVHGPFVRDDEVERIVKFLKLQGEPTYVESVTEDEDHIFDTTEENGKNSGDDLYRQAMELVMREGKVSTSFIQRHLQIGYNRAARIVDQMEKEGVISAANHVGKREILRG